MLVEKEVIGPGVYWYKDEATGLPRKLVVTPELTKHWHDQGNAMLSDGLTVPVPYEHDFQANPMTPKDKLLNNAGEVKQYTLKNGRLFSTVDVQDPDVKKKIGTSIRWTSPWINSFTDGNGKEWKNVISHLALTTRPRVVKQEPFSGIAAALSMATETTVNNITDKGMCLSRAGILNKTGWPEYPVAFSMWGGGVPLTTDTSGHEHDESGKFSAGSKSAHEKSMKAIDAHKSVNRSAAQAIASASHKAHKAAKAGNHEHAYKHHGEASRLHRNIAKQADKRNDHRVAGIHHAAADEHENMADMHEMAHHGKSLAVDDEKERENEFEFDEGSSDNYDNDENDFSDPLADANGDIGMEELLCDLLQALGVPMPDESNEAEFKRHLYEAAMSKIKELTSKGMSGDKKSEMTNQNNPPGSNPHTSQPNPLIQQEQQPMYMSLEDINKLPDPMKGVALAMYNENVKLRAEMEADKKVVTSLRDAKLKEAGASRLTRVGLLSRLSPKVKTDLDAMLALPTMALSMGDGGEVVDPMAQTLAILEKGLSDMPRLLTTDRAALSEQPHPTDGSEMTPEKADELADGFAQRMGAPPVEKKKAS